MNTAHQILTETTLARERREIERRMWSELLRARETQSVLALVWLGMFGLFALFGGVFMSSRAADILLIYSTSVAFLAITSPILFAGRRRKEKALLAIIAQEAPQLFKRLHDEKVA